MKTYDLRNADDLDELFGAAGLDTHDFSGYSVLAATKKATRRDDEATSGRRFTR